MVTFLGAEPRSFEIAPESAGVKPRRLGLTVGSAAARRVGRATASLERDPARPHRFTWLPILPDNAPEESVQRYSSSSLPRQKLAQPISNQDRQSQLGAKGLQRTTKQTRTPATPGFANRDQGRLAHEIRRRGYLCSKKGLGLSDLCLRNAEAIEGGQAIAEILEVAVPGRFRRCEHVSNDPKGPARVRSGIARAEHSTPADEEHMFDAWLRRPGGSPADVARKSR